MTPRARRFSHQPRPSRPGDAVLLEERQTRSGHHIGIVTLNSEQTLNALSLEMIDRLLHLFMDWRDREDVVAVVLRGAGERAFCAGGDIQALYQAMQNKPAAGEPVSGYPATFFSREYRLDYMMHDFNKPIITLGDGIVMGGGLGLFIASEFRIVTERTRLAMPEISIGLFPDAGGTWIMRNLGHPAAQFLSMTGSPLNAGDCLKTKLGTQAIPASRMDDVIDALMQLKYVTADKNSGRIKRCLNRLRTGKYPASNLRKHRWKLHKHLARLKPTVQGLVAEIRSMEGYSDWIDSGIASMNRGCPTSLGIVHEQLARCRSMEMADGFRMELVVAVNCAHRPDFAEGIRAIVIDKDNRPAWKYPSVEELPSNYVLEHFKSPWPANPLHDIEDCRTVPLAFGPRETEKEKKKRERACRKSGTRNVKHKGGQKVVSQ